MKIISKALQQQATLYWPFAVVIVVIVMYIFSIFFDWLIIIFSMPATSAHMTLSLILYIIIVVGVCQKRFKARARCKQVGRRHWSCALLDAERTSWQKSFSKANAAAWQPYSVSASFYVSLALLLVQLFPDFVAERFHSLTITQLESNYLALKYVDCGACVFAPWYSYKLYLIERDLKNDWMLRK